MAKTPPNPDIPEAPISAEDIRTGLSPEALARSFRDNLYYQQGRFAGIASLNDFYQATAHTVRDRLLKRWVETHQKLMETSRKAVCYFSAEFLIGPQLGNNLINLGIFREAEQAFASAGLKTARHGLPSDNLEVRLEHLLEEEEEPGLKACTPSHR